MFKSCQFGKEDPPPTLASGPLCHSQRQQAVRGDGVVFAPVVGPAVVLHGAQCLVVGTVSSTLSPLVDRSQNSAFR